jgi:hypothetical protein
MNQDGTNQVRLTSNAATDTTPAWSGMATTAANVYVSGRVYDSTGSGLRNAVVRLMDLNGSSRTVRTGSFGYYRFEGLAGGQTYVFIVSGKCCPFTPQIVTVLDNLDDISFSADM